MDDVPRHIAIIMDGNGRWARERGLPRMEGHRAGVNAVRKAIEGCLDFKIKYLTIFAFSTENWERPRKEVRGLMKLFPRVIEKEIGELKEQQVRVRFLGRLNSLPDEVKNKVDWIQRQTKNLKKMNLIIALNYGGRQEIVDAANKAIEEGEKVDVESFSDYLYLPDVPDPDLLIRTSGEIRISNFLLYEIAYSELYFTEKYWPDFDRSEIIKAIKSYQRRERRFGGLT